VILTDSLKQFKTLLEYNNVYMAVLQF